MISEHNSPLFEENDSIWSYHTYLSSSGDTLSTISWHREWVTSLIRFDLEISIRFRRNFLIFVISEAKNDILIHSTRCIKWRTGVLPIWYHNFLINYFWRVFCAYNDITLKHLETIGHSCVERWKREITGISDVRPEYTGQTSQIFVEQSPCYLIDYTQHTWHEMTQMIIDKK